MPQNQGATAEMELAVVRRGRRASTTASGWGSLLLGLLWLPRPRRAWSAEEPVGQRLATREGRLGASASLWTGDAQHEVQPGEMGCVPAPRGRAEQRLVQQEVAGALPATSGASSASLHRGPDEEPEPLRSCPASCLRRPSRPERPARPSPRSWSSRGARERLRRMRAPHPVPLLETSTEWCSRSSRRRSRS